MKKKSAAQLVRERDEDRFMSVFATNGGNATQAALTVWPDLKYEQAKKKGHLIANNDEVRERFRKRVNKQTSREVMTFVERQEFLSSVARGEYQSSMKDRISAVKVLNQMDSVGSTINVVNISVDDKRKMVENKINEMLGLEVIDGEYTESGTAENTGLIEIGNAPQETA